ncbi:MAG: TetR family transcriptional regulator C-terminal domain-containing protein [Bacteroidales bacterium]|nr:TetR family transcriptional regulator C-terminal domain-containing protein [Bacteroidales bacterium]MDY0215515.1 TetR family transcriptional regulator C-terminal domain-containing protein [Bacteroidales bacterium]
MNSLNIDEQLNKKNELTLVALETFSKNDHLLINTQNVCEAMDIDEEEFLTLFRDFDEFLMHLIAFYTKNILELIEPILSDIKVEPLKRIENLYSYFVDYYVNKNTFPFGTIANRIIHMTSDSDVRQAAFDVFNMVKRSHYLCIIEAKKNGSIDPRVDADKLSEFIINAWEGTLMQFYASRTIKTLFVFNIVLRKSILHTV